MLGSALLFAPDIAVTAERNVLLVSLALLLLSIQGAKVTLGYHGAIRVYIVDFLPLLAFSRLLPRHQ